MHAKLRTRIWLTWAACGLVFVFGVLVVVMCYLSANLNTPEVQSFPFGARLMGALASSLYHGILPLRLLWPLMPRTGAGLLEFMSNGIVLLGIGLGVFGAMAGAQARQANTRLNEALAIMRRDALTERLGGGNVRQATGAIHNNSGNVTIHQEVRQREVEVEEWGEKFWAGPVGVLAIGVAGTLIAAFLGNLLGLTH